MTTRHDRAPSDTSILGRMAPHTVTGYTRTLAWLTLVVQVVIVATGGAVRLSGSGLGCPTWPSCTPDSLVATPEMGIHGAIEFGNRLLTFVLVAVAVLTFLAVVRTRGSGRSLVAPALLIGLGIPAQGVIGGISVLTKLNPYVVGVHFLVSVALVSLSVLLVWRVYHRPGAGLPFPRWFHGAAWLTAGLALLTILVGVLTTGSGPHAGDGGAARNGLDPQLLQRLHSYPAYGLFAVTLLMVFASFRLPATAVRRYAMLLLVAEGAQIAVGVAQARLGLPVLLVGVHLVLACLVTAAVTALLLAVRQGTPAPAQAAPAPAPAQGAAAPAPAALADVPFRSRVPGVPGTLDRNGYRTEEG